MRKILLLLAAALLLPFAGDRAAASEQVELLAYGDSLVHGYGLASPENFPSQLQAALRAEGHGVEVVNGGNSGDTSAAGLARLDWTLSSQLPDAAILVLGANDALAAWRVSTLPTRLPLSTDET